MFSNEERDQVRADLLKAANSDGRISGTAITGSAATRQDDRWSDIDIAFGVANADELKPVISDWTAHMYDQHSALHHVDLMSGAWTYRVFLLPSTLQVDLAFAPATEFRPLAATFRLVSGKALESRPAPPAPAGQLIGLGWLYALHARSSIARRRLWQAEYMISAVRDHALALACLRHSLPTAYGRGIDLLPHSEVEQYESAIVRSLEPGELWRAFGVAVDRLLKEIRIGDPELAERLETALSSLIEN